MGKCLICSMKIPLVTKLMMGEVAFLRQPVASLLDTAYYLL